MQMIRWKIAIRPISLTLLVLLIFSPWMIPLSAVAQSGTGKTSPGKGGTIPLGSLNTAGIPVGGTGGNSYPPAEFRMAFGYIADGNLKDASDAFESLGKRGYRMGTVRWLDSICYSAMLGECWYEAGENLRALACFEDSLQLALDNAGWMSRINYDAAQMPQARPNATLAPWGTSRVPGVPAKYNDVQIGRGSTDVEGQIQRGGVFQAAHYMIVQPQEICYATTLAIMRRAELLGAVSKYDPMTKNVASALENSGCPRNHWMIVWADIPLAAAMIADGRDDEAEKILVRSTLVAGQYMHPLGGLAYILLGDISRRRGDLTAAANFYGEATFAAFPYEDPVVFGMAFERLSSVALATGNAAGLMEALVWSRGTGGSSSSRFAAIRAQLALTAAEMALDGGRPDEAAKFLTEAGMIFARRTIGNGPLGVRHQFLQAALAWSIGKISDGDQLLTTALRRNHGMSLRLFHLQTILQYSKTSSLATARRQVEMFRALLTDPSAEDWRSDPLEAMTLLSAVNDAAYLHYFLATQGLSDQTAAIAETFEVAEQIRRRRFFASLDTKPGGARLFALRMLLESDPQMMTDAERRSRTHLLGMLPEWEAASRRAAVLKRQIASTGFATLDDPNQSARNAAAMELAEISTAQELMLHRLALRRVDSPLTFPPRRSLKAIQSGLPDGTAVLTYIMMGGRCHAFLFNNQHIVTWEVKNAATVARGTATYLKMLGLNDARKAVAASDLKDPKDPKKGTWMSIASALGAAIVAGAPFDPTDDGFQELVIVPDGVFWYVPFESLHYDFGNRAMEPLVSRRRIRYAPTASLAIPDQRPVPARPTTFFVAGKMDGSTEPTIAPTKIYERIENAVPEAVRIGNVPLAAPVSSYKGALGRLVVWHDVANDPTAPGLFVPTGFGKGRAGSTLIEWLMLPWGGPDLVSLPGFHSAADGALKTVPSIPGDEFFLTACAMMANGSRTLVLPRWKMGGESAAVLTEEFLREIPAQSASQSWQRAVLLLRESKLQLAREPRIQLAPDDDPTVSGDHPLFWSGYLVFDRGAALSGSDVDPDEAIGDDADPTAVGDADIGDVEGDSAESGGDSVIGEGDVATDAKGTTTAGEGKPPIVNPFMAKADTAKTTPIGKVAPTGKVDSEKTLPASKPESRPFTSRDDPETYEDNIADDLSAVGL